MPFQDIELAAITAPEVVIDQAVMDSIKEFGLLHPITVKDAGEGRFILSAGRQRFACIKKLGWGTVPALVLNVDTPSFMSQEISIQENLKRQNLPWWQICILEKELHDLRQQQHGKAKSGPKKEGWSLRDTATEMGVGFGNLSEDLRLAEAVMANPTLRKLEDKVTAKRLIFGMAKRMEAEDEAGLPLSIDTPFNVALHGDSATILAQYPDKFFDACITDPPWLEYKDKTLTKDDRTVPVFDQIFRVLKSDAFLYAFVGMPDWIFYKDYLEKIGFKVQGIPLLWQKINHLSHGLRSWEYMRDFEPILLAVKGSPHLTQSTPPSSIFTYPILHPTKSVHPNEKPIELITKILNQCTYEGSMVLDPFGGSGVTAKACQENSRRYVTIERDRKFYEQIEQRLAR